ncbi:DUF1501 domain-containing protein [Rubripirellula reticaptiva]|uniref:DUF1501 domain-containing protein n=1 Tax=Rubripirellula reticaptiva TaxID=2528013 RepID=UPI001FEA9C76|nr:DUF1501 domain-containing protein [Rubripirellula reticaptiva]
MKATFDSFSCAVVQLFSGVYASGGKLTWDEHSNLKEQDDTHAAVLDQTIVALIKT